MPSPQDDRGNFLLLEEYFDAEDERFVETLRQVHAPKQLAAFTERWKKDPRPWARQQMFAYLDQPFNCVGHQPVVKRLFKHAEANHDDDLMAAFLHAFDCLVRRVRMNRRRWDWQTRTSWEEEYLATPRNTVPAQESRRGVNPATGERIQFAVRRRPGALLFSHRTRYYLRRRVWRYFRRMGFQRPDDYPKAIARALERYTDQDLASGVNILDSWGLMHACFRRHDALEFKATHIALKEGRGLGELTPAPRFLELWQKQESASLLFSLLTKAQSRLVRVWAMQLLRAHHGAQLDLTPDDIVRLLDHGDEEVQQFGAELLNAATAGLETLPVSAWLRFLQTRNLTALQTVCDVMTKHVSAERLTLVQCVGLACARPTPVARLGLQFLQTRVIKTAEERQAIVTLANTQCAAAGKEITQWALAILGAREVYSADVALHFFDSLNQEVRAGAWEWLLSGSPGCDDPVVWSRLVETPFDDMRLRLVDQLEKRSKLLGANGSLAPFWSAVLLNVHRGGRQKLKAVHQVSRAIQENPAQAETLLPVLAVAMRSVRAPEARAGLAAVVSAVDARPELADAVKRHLPELNLLPAEAAA